MSYGEQDFKFFNSDKVLFRKTNIKTEWDTVVYELNRPIMLPLEGGMETIAVDNLTVVNNCEDKCIDMSEPGHVELYQNAVIAVNDEGTIEDCPNDDMIHTYGGVVFAQASIHAPINPKELINHLIEDNYA